MSFIDPPLPQTDIEGEIVRLSGLLEEQTAAMAQHATTAAEVDAAYDRSYYSVFVRAEGPMELRKAISKDRTANQYAQKVAAEAVLDSVKEQGRNLRAQLDSLRTLAASHRALVTGG